LISAAARASTEVMATLVTITSVSLRAPAPWMKLRRE
jgi:hypothetical protein